MRVLLAEDDAVAGRTLTAILTAQGHEVTAVDNGVDAWGLWKVSRHRVIVSDWLMPAMDGIELCRRIRADAALDGTYVILLTACQDRQTKNRALNAGADDFLTKPCDNEELTARLRNGLRISKLQEHLRRAAAE